MFEKQRILFFCNKKSSPNPSYLHSGEFVLPWDAKNRSSHTQIVHIEILRAQMYLKSAETEGNLLSEHMNIFARNRLLVPKGVILYSTNIIIHFYDGCGSEGAFSPAAPRRSRTIKLERSQELGQHRENPSAQALFGEIVNNGTCISCRITCATIATDIKQPLINI